MQDPRFYRTVILITKDDHEGSSGFILNRPTESLVSEAFPWHTGLKKKKDVIYWGGPVGVQQVFVLFRSKKKPDYSLNVLDDVYFTASVDILEEMARAKKSINRFRVILGYAGWAPGQMRSEIIRGDWLILSADADTIFMKDPSGMWENLRMLGGGQQAQRAPWNSHRKPSS